MISLLHDFEGTFLPFKTNNTFQSLFDAFSAAFCSNYFDAEEERTLSTYIEREILMRYSQTYVFQILRYWQ